MKNYKVLYIDEEEYWRDSFTRYAHDEFEVEVIPPFDNQDELINYIQNTSANAVILDHLLSEHMPEITYDGVEVVKILKKRNARFPLFVLTSHDMQAMEESEDVNYVYPKSVISEKEKQLTGKGEFNDRIRLQIKHYIEAQDEAENEFNGLIQKAESAPLNGVEEERLIELDTFLNEYIGRDLDIPEHLKRTSNAKITSELIKVSQELMQKIEAKQGDKDA
jgi:DNA-binding NarL/FixJ family response regulator